MDDEKWRGLRERLDALKNQLLTPAAFIALANELSGRLPQEANGYRLRAVRDEDFNGVQVAVELQSADPGARSASATCQTHERVSLGRETLDSSTGYSSFNLMRTAEDGFQNFDAAASRALGAASDQPFLLEISSGQAPW